MAKTKKPGKTEQVIAMLRRRPYTVTELSKATGASVSHVRSILYQLDGVKIERSLTKYSLRRVTR
jgi:DNA-binding transcriptional regulator GbsR (MarR family)